MTDPSQYALARQLVPSLLVSDMDETLAFYEALGFRVDASHPDRESATWVRVTFGDIALMFYTQAPDGTPGAPICSGTLYVNCADVDALAERWRSVTGFAWGPEKMWYGTYEFAVKDPNGYYLAFVSHAE